MYKMANYLIQFCLISVFTVIPYADVQGARDFETKISNKSIEKIAIFGSERRQGRRQMRRYRRHQRRDFRWDGRQQRRDFRWDGSQYRDFRWDGSQYRRDARQRQYMQHQQIHPQQMQRQQIQIVPK